MSDESEYYDDEAVEMTEEVEVPVETPESYKLKGDDFYRAKNYQKAIDAYTSAISIQVGLNCNFYTNRSAAYLMIGSYQEALKDCETGMSIEPNNPKIYFKKVSPYQWRHEDCFVKNLQKLIIINC